MNRVDDYERLEMTDVERLIGGGPLPMRPGQRLTASIDADWVMWSLKEWTRRKDPPIQNYDKVLPRFVALAGGSSEKILRFAHVFGPLGLCGTHPEWPLLHQPTCVQPAVVAPPRPTTGDELQAQRYLESIVIKESRPSWLKWANKVRSILELNRAVREGRLGDPDDWKAVFVRPPAPADNRFDYLAVAVNTFLQLSRPVPVVSHNGTGILTMRFASAIAVAQRSPLSLARLRAHSVLDGTLFTAIMTALATAVASGRALVKCSNPDCGALHTPTRATTEGQRHFCLGCGKRASWRLSKQRARHPETAPPADRKENLAGKGKGV